MKNPLYKGKWSPKKIKNPLYKGPWSPKKISNPNYYEEKNPIKSLPSIGAIAFDLWTMNKDTIFNNILFTTNEKVAENYAKSTWQVKFEAEKLLVPKTEIQSSNSAFDFNKIKNKLQEIAQDYPIPIIATSLVILITIPYLLFQCCSGGGGKKEEIEEEEEVELKETKKELNKTPLNETKTNGTPTKEEKKEEETIINENKTQEKKKKLN